LRSAEKRETAQARAAFGDEAFNELRTAGVAEIGFFTEQKDGRTGLPFPRRAREFPGGDLGHQKFSRTAATSFCAKSFARRSRADLALEKSSQSRLGIGTARGGNFIFVAEEKIVGVE